MIKYSVWLQVFKNKKRLSFLLLALYLRMHYNQKFLFVILHINFSKYEKTCIYFFGFKPRSSECIFAAEERPYCYV